MKTERQLLDLSLLPCHQLTGVVKKLSERLLRLGIHCVQDVLFHLPLRYQNRTEIRPMRQLMPGDPVVVQGEIDDVTQPKVGRTRAMIRIKDATGHLYLRFFHMTASQCHTLQPGTVLTCFGEVRLGTRGLEMVHPEYHIGTVNISVQEEDSLTPIYPATDGITQTMLRKLTKQALQLVTNGGVLKELLPSSLLKTIAFPTLQEAIQFVHRPPATVSVEKLMQGQHDFQKRLAFEELLAHRLSLLQLKKSFQTQRAFSLKNQGILSFDFLRQLPFELTRAQKKVAEEVRHDLNEPHPMLRLVQGDVGSGKTAVAALAILQAIESGYQAAVLAPTELLAEQHFHVFTHWLTPLQIQVVLLSGQMKTAAKREALKRLVEHQAHVVVGTHALFQKNVQFAKLALVVVDEQHRFGVQQRAQLREKGTYNHCYPHQLIMTATPIPRTLAMSVYADLDYSVIDELPPGRTPITTRVIANTRRDEVLERIRIAAASGRQAYWVCTLIEESDVLQCKAAENTAKELTAFLPNIKIGLLHGKMKNAEKEEVMAAFKRADIHLLVATTVIEVGVDVPNASLMVIENAERLGLAQLHQLRGRVGRGAVASHCVLMYQAPLSYFAKERLAVMRETTDGFHIAQRDLELRGPGEVLGTRQTGEVALRMADLLRDSELLPQVEHMADQLQQEYPDSIPLLIKRWLGKQQDYGHV